MLPVPAHCYVCLAGGRVLRGLDVYIQPQAARRVLSFSIQRNRGSFGFFACSSNIWYLFAVRKLIYLLGNSQSSVQRMSDRPHHMVCLMERLKLHLRSGSHNRIRTVRAVADYDIFCAVLLKLQTLLRLSRTVARILALQRRARLRLNSLLASCNRTDLAVHLLTDLTHTVFASAARADKKPNRSSVQIREFDRYDDTACRLRNRCV